MWSVYDHLRLLSRWDRAVGLVNAVRSRIKQGDKVLDAGCGSGICSLLAAQNGASRVIGVERDSVDLALALAKENNLSDRVSFIQGDLSTIELNDCQGAIDAVISMIYHNDPRRDEYQSEIALELRKKYLKPGGIILPDRVRYIVYACEWPAFDIQGKLSQCDREILEIQGRYQLSFNALRSRVRKEIDVKFFPERNMKNGKIGTGIDWMELSDPGMFLEIDYYQDSFSYPSQFELKIISPGRMNTIKWVQELWSGDILIFSNESLSYIKNTKQVKPGETVTVTIDKEWRSSNVATLL